MFKQTEKYLRGHRMEIYIMRLWMIGCRLLPVVTELVIRRFLSFTVGGYTLALLLAFGLNRMLLAPATTGYYACCLRLARKGEKDGNTCPIEDLQTEMQMPTLLKCFLWDYRHPWISFKWLLKWDIFRFIVYFVCCVPGLAIIVFGAKEEGWLQLAFGSGGALLCLVGLLCAVLIRVRIQPMLFVRPQYDGFLRGMLRAFRQTKGCTGGLLYTRMAWVKYGFLPWIPFFLFRTACYVQQAALYVRSKTLQNASKSSYHFHTRVLRDT